MQSEAEIPNIEQVYESEASQEVAEIYTDIRETMSMSFVNLIWRRLAVSPEGLRWTWQSMKPLYTSGYAYAEAAALNAGQELPPVPQLPTAALRAVGVDADAEASIRAALAGYERGNPLNTVAFSAIRARLDPAAFPTAQDAERLTPTHPPQVATPPAPKLMSFEDMDADLTRLVHAVTRLGARGDGLRVQVSLPRNLAHWPGFLSLYLTALQPLHDDGRLFAAVDRVWAEGNHSGARLAQHLADIPDPSPEAAGFVRETLDMLVPHAMGRMIPVVSLLTRMLPPAE
ncbi:hypothetical protein RKLH11_3658 [Rhodobacteraceae bacterium KLH11]|nr:hypothetical protein RKLH11_3658 [Rhodobacteraceae bacterium KLH11]